MKNSGFIIYPAVDMHAGRVVRLKQGNLDQQTVYSSDPEGTARGWFQAGAKWIHVVNLDGAFGSEDSANRQALEKIVQQARRFGSKVQLGGGLRSVEAINDALAMGVDRVILGTVLVEQPEILAEAIQEAGPERVAAGIDARDGMVRVRGWAENTQVNAVTLAESLAAAGLRWLIYTDIARDGMGTGLNLTATVELARRSGLSVIASGGIKTMDDVQAARGAGLAGAIVGRALYEGTIKIADLKSTIW
jgi:phosphoribosylformimino-5-aminoimidazole carboxamide ribotide isomerase